MFSTDQIERLLSGGTVVSQGGEKIGKVGQVFLDDRSGEPEWVTVKTGLFGRAESFVPLSDADVQGDEIRVPFDKDRVKGAPRVDDSEGHLSAEEEAELYRYYGRARAGTGDDPSRAGDQDERHGASDRDRHDEQDRQGGAADERPDEAAVVGRHAAGPATDDASATSDDDTAGRVRLRRYVVTEYETRTVPTEQSGTEGQGLGEERKVSERVREEIVETEGEDDRP